MINISQKCIQWFISWTYMININHVINNNFGDISALIFSIFGEYIFQTSATYYRIHFENIDKYHGKNKAKTFFKSSLYNHIIHVLFI